MKKTLPMGEKFLPHTSMEKLEGLYRKETDRKAGEGLLAYMARKRGEPLQKIGKSLCRPHTTTRNWILPCAAGGLDRLYGARRPGPARRPAAGQLAGLKGDPMAGSQEHGFESGMWAGKMVAGPVLSRYEVQYVPRTMQELPRGTGLGHARPGHPKAAPEEAKKALKKSG